MAETSTNLHDDADKDLVDIVMTGGPPWGFNVSGGSEFGTDVFIKKVSEDGIARKAGGLQEGDILVYVNDMKCTSRSKAIEAVRSGKNELRIKLRRNASEEGMDGFVTRSGPKRSRSFYESVVEDMLEKVTDDISCTQYSNRKFKIREDKENENGNKMNAAISEEVFQEDAVINEKDEQKENLMPSDDSMSPRRTSSGSVQKVTIKSVNVTAMVPKAKDASPDQMKLKQDAHDSKYSPIRFSCSNTESASKDDGIQTQSKSMDETGPTVLYASGNPSGLRKTNKAPPVASKPFKPEQPRQESGIETPALSVIKARAMFEGISKSQENLAASSAKSHSTDSLLKIEDKATPSASVDRKEKDAIPSDSVNPLQPEKERLIHTHSHSKSLPLETEETSRRIMRRPGSAPHRRSERNTKAKSAHFPSEKELFQSQNLPLGYADIPSASNITRARKSIANCSPGITNYSYKKESSFRHSSEDLRFSDNLDIAGRKSATLPAHQMREAAKKFHQDLMRKDPKFRFSLNAGDSSTRPAHLGSFTGGSSGSSIGSSQDMLQAIDLSRRASGPTFFTRASSTSSLVDSPPGHLDATYGGADEDNSILSRLLREQRLNSGGSLVRIEEEARSPRGKTFVAKDGTLLSDIGEPGATDKSGKRTMCIQTDFVYDEEAKRDASERCTSSASSQPTVTKSVVSSTAGNANVTDINRPHDQASHACDTSPETAKTLASKDKYDTSHEKEPSTDSVHELREINNQKENNDVNTDDSQNSFILPDIDALPPPPDDLLIGSPPEKEKPQRVINRKKRDQHPAVGSSRNSSCVSTDSTISTATADSGIGVRTFSTSDSPRTSPTRENSEPEDYDKDPNVDEGFKSSKEALDDEEYGSHEQSKSRLTPSEFSSELASPVGLETPNSSRGGSRPDSLIFVSPKIEELDQETSALFKSMRKNIEVLKSQEKEIGDEIKLNDDLGRKVQGLVERKATQTEFSKYELFIGELEKIVALLLSLTQRLHRYEHMLQDLDMSEEEDKEKRDNLVSKIEKLKSQLEDASYLREVNDKRGENVANFLDKYFNEEEFQDFLYYVDMKSQLALMQSEIKEKVKLGEERYKALANTSIGWATSTETLQSK